MASFEIKSNESELVDSGSLKSTEDDNVCGPCTNFALACAFEEMNPRRRNTMEDVHRVVKSLKGSPEYSYFGVYDGHGGRQIADFLEETLESNISVELQQPDDASILERLQRAYLITDMQSRRLNIVTSGATAVSALLRTEYRADSSTLADSSSGSGMRGSSGHGLWARPAGRCMNRDTAVCRHNCDGGLGCCAVGYIRGQHA